MSRVGIDKDLLDKECSDGHLRRMSSLLPDWLTYAKALGFTEPETRDITDNPQLSNSTHAMKALRVLEKWHRRHGGHVTIATEICKMFKGWSRYAVCYKYIELYLQEKMFPMQRTRARPDHLPSLVRRERPLNTVSKVRQSVL